MSKGIIQTVVKGKKLSKRCLTFYSPDEKGFAAFAKKHNASIETFEQEIERNLAWATDNLKHRGLPIIPPEGFKTVYHYLTADTRYRGLGKEHDSLEALEAKMLWHLECIMKDQLDIQERLRHAMKWGECSTLWDHYADLAIRQKASAEQERKKGLTLIFGRLKAEKYAGAKPKELWPQFVSMLSEDTETFQDVKENATNRSNCKAWSVDFTIIPDKDGKPFKNEKMAYDRFVRRLNEK